MEQPKSSIVMNNNNNNNTDDENENINKIVHPPYYTSPQRGVIKKDKKEAKKEIKQPVLDEDSQILAERATEARIKRKLSLSAVEIPDKEYNLAKPFFLVAEDGSICEFYIKASIRSSRRRKWHCEPLKFEGNGFSLSIPRLCTSKDTNTLLFTSTEGKLIVATRPSSPEAVWPTRVFQPLVHQNTMDIEQKEKDKINEREALKFIGCPAVYCDNEDGHALIAIVRDSLFQLYAIYLNNGQVKQFEDIIAKTDPEIIYPPYTRKNRIEIVTTDSVGSLYLLNLPEDSEHFIVKSPKLMENQKCLVANDGRLSVLHGPEHCHIFYRGISFEIFEMYKKNPLKKRKNLITDNTNTNTNNHNNSPTKKKRKTSWKCNNIAAKTSAPLATHSPLSMISLTTHVFFADFSGNLHEIWWKPTGIKRWKHVNITKRANAESNVETPLHCQVSKTAKDHIIQNVLYADANGQFFELTWQYGYDWEISTLSEGYPNFPKIRVRPFSHETIPQLLNQLPTTSFFFFKK